MSKLLESLAQKADCIELDNTSQTSVLKIRHALSIINIIMTDSQIVNAVMHAFTSKQAYVSILPLSQKIKLSLPEVEKLLDMGKAEHQAFEYLTNECNNQSNLKTKLNILKLEVQITGEITPVGNYHEILDEVHDDLEFLFTRKYRNVAFRAGYKKLLLKAAIASAIYGEPTEGK